MKILISTFKQLQYCGKSWLYQVMKVGLPRQQLQYILLFTEQGIKILGKENRSGADIWLSVPSSYHLWVVGEAIEEADSIALTANADPFELFHELAKERFYIDSIGIDKMIIEDDDNCVSYYKVYVEENMTLSMMKLQHFLSPQIIWHPIGKLSPADIDFIPEMIEDYETGHYHTLMMQNEYLVRLLQALKAGG